MRDKKRDSKYKNSHIKNVYKKGSPVRKKKKFSIKLMLSEFKILSLKSNMDLPFLFLVLTILVIGLVMMFSASYPNAYYLHKGDSFYFIKNQVVFAIMGVIAMIAISHIDYSCFHRWAVPILCVSFFLLVIVLLMPARNGVHRWVQLGSFSFQASEIGRAHV